jgi:RNA polymerase sigma-54 factor
MALKIFQQFKQQQRLSPQQIQTIRMLELPSLEMEERIKNELDENPALEEGKDLSDENDFEDDFENDKTNESNEDISLGDYMNEDDIPDYKLAEISNREEHKESTPFNNDQSLTDYLLQQLQLTEISEEEKRFGEYLIGNLDNDGYLRRSLVSIADDMTFQTGIDVKISDMEKSLNLIRKFDPPGIGAANLQECLLLQIKRRKKTNEVVYATKILSDYFEDLSHKHYDRIRKFLNIDGEEMKAVINEITSLNPKPGSSWDDSMITIMNSIIPDFIVETQNNDLILTLNNKGVPDLRINREFSNMLKDYAGNKANRTSEMRDAITFIELKLKAAQGFIDAVRQRQYTLQSTMEAIVLLQEEFFMTGDESKLRPMILKDVAKKTGFDISTISRVSSSKYVQTNFGVYPLKFFFSEGSQTESGETISTRKIKQIILKEIESENKKKPVTDDEMTRILNDKGYLIARRTVAKYREQQGIPVARMRKEL